MANLQINQLPAASVPLTGAELVPLMQGSVTSQTPAGALSSSTSVRQVATYAALTALTTATGLVDGGLYYTKCRAASRDGGQGVWQYVAASTTTANGGTILAIDGGGAGRFFRLLDDAKTHDVAWFGVLGSATGAVNQAGIIACAAALNTLGTGVMEFDGSQSYAIYPTNTDTAALINWSGGFGLHFKTNGCTFTIARPFANGDVIFPIQITDCVNTIIGDHTVTCAQLDEPADSLNRGTWWMVFEGCAGIRGGNVTVNGGRVAVDLVRQDADITNQCSDVYFQSITTDYVFYPLSCRYSGRGVTVDRISCKNGGRPFIGYGFRGVRINEMYTQDMQTSTFVFASSQPGDGGDTDPNTIGFYIKFHVDLPVGPQGIGGLFGMGCRGTDPCVLSDITVVYDNIVFSGANGSEGLFSWTKGDDAGAPDSVVRGHTVENITLLGSATVSALAGTEVMNFAFNPATDGSYVGENVSNWRVAVSVQNGTSQHYINGDFGAFKGGLDLSGLLFEGWQRWIGNRPKEYASPNLLYNGNFNVRQLGDTFTSASTPANNDDTYLYDGMILLSDGNDTVDVTLNTADAPADTLGVMQMEVATANRKFGALFPLEQKDCAGAIGEQVCGSIRMRKGSGNATLDSVKMAIISWSGTADAITSDVVSTWNGAGSAPTLVANWTYETGVVNATNVQFVTTTFTTFCVTGKIDTASAKQFALFVWCDDTDATVGDTLLMCDAMLQPGWMTTAYPVGDFQSQLARCRRMLRRSAYHVPATTAQNLATIDMRAVPTITGGGAGFDSTGTTADTLIAFETGAAVETLTLDANL